MPARLLGRGTPVEPGSPAAPGPARPEPDPGYEALPRLARLGDALAAAVPRARTGRWREPPLFFFDRRRQAELEAARPTRDANPFAELSRLVAAELPALCRSVEVRRVARAVDGLRAAAAALAPVCPAARELAELLAVPDDETVLVLHPGLRAGFRLVARGVADVGQFHVLVAASLAGHPADDFLAGVAVPERFVAACRYAEPAVPAGVPMVARAWFQLYAPAALGPDGELPRGMAGCEHWLWPQMPLAAVPRVNGERVVLFGPPAYPVTWAVTRRFPAMAAELRATEVLGTFRVADELGKLVGKPVPVVPRAEPEPLAAKAA